MAAQLVIQDLQVRVHWDHTPATQRKQQQLARCGARYDLQCAVEPPDAHLSVPAADHQIVSASSWRAEWNDEIEAPANGIGLSLGARCLTTAAGESPPAQWRMLPLVERSPYCTPPPPVHVSGSHQAAALTPYGSMVVHLVKYLLFQACRTPSVTLELISNYNDVRGLFERTTQDLHCMIRAPQHFTADAGSESPAGPLARLHAIHVRVDLVDGESDSSCSRSIGYALGHAISSLQLYFPWIFDATYIHHVRRSMHYLPQISAALSKILRSALDPSGGDLPKFDILQKLSGSVASALHGNRHAIAQVLYHKLRQNMAPRSRQPLTSFGLEDYFAGRHAEMDTDESRVHHPHLLNGHEHAGGRNVDDHSEQEFAQFLEFKFGIPSLSSNAALQPAPICQAAEGHSSITSELEPSSQEASFPNVSTTLTVVQSSCIETMEAVQPCFTDDSEGDHFEGSSNLHFHCADALQTSSPAEPALSTPNLTPHPTAQRQAVAELLDRHWVAEERRRKILSDV